MSGFFIFNGQFQSNETAVIGPESRAFRYGDGLFETIRVAGTGKIPLAGLHFQRALRGLKKMAFENPESPDQEQLSEEILALCRKNNIYGPARVRLVFFRGDGGVFDAVSHTAKYTIQAWPLAAHYESFDTSGVELTVFNDARKTMDEFANLKSNNFLPYIMAGIHARREMCNEALVLNSDGRIADATTANVFLVKDNRIITNPLSEGPVAGVMREYLLEQLPDANFDVEIKPIDVDLLSHAEEILLTNAVSGIRWVSGFGGKTYDNRFAKSIYERIVSPLFSGKK